MMNMSSMAVHNDTRASVSHGMVQRAQTILGKPPDDSVPLWKTFWFTFGYIPCFCDSPWESVLRDAEQESNMII